MKKLLVLALAVVLCLSLVACGNKNEESQVEPGSRVETVDEVPEIIVVPEEPEEELPEEISGEEVAEEVVEEISGEIEE